MKKTLFILALVLTIVTSLAAGTLATYTKTLAPIGGEVTAKQFYIGATKTAFADVKLAPSQEDTWDFSVINYQGDALTEVDMDLNIVVDVDGAIDGLTVALFEGDIQLGETVVKEGTINYSIDKALDKNVKDQRDFYVKVLWDNTVASDATDTANADAIAQTRIAVTVTGIQDLG